MEKVLDSLLFKFYSRSAVATGAGTLNLVGAPSLTFDVLLDSDIYRREIDMLYDNNVVKAGYLDCFNISQTLTVTALQNFKVSLRNICSFMKKFILKNLLNSVDIQATRAWTIPSEALSI